MAAGERALANVAIFSLTQPVTNLDRPDVSWRFASGLLLHFALPAYIFVLAAVILLAGAPLSLARALHLALTTSGYFVVVYTALTVGISLAVGWAAPRLRRRRAMAEARDPTAATRLSASRAAAALTLFEGIATGSELTSLRIRAAATALRDAAWRHHETPFQALSSDLAMAANAFVKSFDVAEAERRSEIRALAAAALERLAAELRRLTAEHSRLDYGDAQVAARYIELRYGPSDFTGDDAA